VRDRGLTKREFLFGDNLRLSPGRAAVHSLV